MDVGEKRETVGANEETPREDAREKDSTTPEAIRVGGIRDIDFDKVEDMSKIYEETLKDFEEGEVVKGTIVSVGTDSVLVDIGFKSEGTISLSEFPEPDEVKVGDEIDVLIEVAEDQDGMIVLSKAKADKIRDDLLRFLIEQKRAGKKVAAYGAAAKGNTLLNYAGVRPDLLPFVCDAAEAKQGKYMPGSHIPILPPSALMQESPDYVLILPWNIAEEVRQQNAELTERGTRFVTAIPSLEVFS